jgi:hypothetical protein
MNSRFPATLALLVASLFSVSLFAQKCDYDDLLNKNLSLLDNYKFIKSFPVETSRQAEKADYSYLLNRDTKYRVVIADNGRKGERMIVTVRDRDKKVVATNRDKQKKTFSTQMDFVCPATGIYYFEAVFEEDHRDCGLNILGFQK